jgi:hypothetical protein
MIQNILDSLPQLNVKEKIPIIGLLALSFESFNDFSKHFPNSGISNYYWDKGILHNTKTGIGKSFEFQKKFNFKKSNQEMSDLVTFIIDHLEKVSYGTKKLSFDDGTSVQIQRLTKLINVQKYSSCITNYIQMDTNNLFFLKYFKSYHNEIQQEKLVLMPN